MKILLVDDHPMVREGIAAIIRGIRPDLEISHAGTAAQGLAEAQRETFELALLDLNLPDMPGMSALQTLREQHPDLPVVVVSGAEDRDTVLKALDLGAKAFIPKSSDPQRVRQALTAVLSGHIFLPDTVTSALGTGAGLPKGSPSWALTERQLEVLSLLVAGLPNKLIARRLQIAESTVKIHVSAVLRELRVASRTQAIIAVARANIRLPTVE